MTHWNFEPPIKQTDEFSFVIIDDLNHQYSVLIPSCFAGRRLSRCSRLSACCCCRCVSAFCHSCSLFTEAHFGFCSPFSPHVMNMTTEIYELAREELNASQPWMIHSTRSECAFKTIRHLGFSKSTAADEAFIRVWIEKHILTLWWYCLWCFPDQNMYINIR